ncbi:MAG: DUF2017 domain-containing protein [Actinomycetota bacterium]|nr:DUF2017 domain-containing protein [Actinomycetota bacterium]
MTSRPVRRTRDGFYKLSLSDDERALLADLAPQMRAVLADSEDPVVERLLPVAYPEDADRQTEYRLLVQDELMESHIRALAVLEETAKAERLDEEQLLAWMRAINQVRLVMGGRLEVTEDGSERPTSPDDHRLPGFAVYDYLSALQDDIISALSRGGVQRDS